MHVTLVHNPGAGDGRHSREQLIAALRAHGHDVAYHAASGRDLDRALAEPADLVLVAGGDGTVGKVARALGGRTARIAILPLGTANNVARSIGIDPDSPPLDVIDALASAEERPLDTAVARAPWGTHRFVESAGVGFFADSLAQPPDRDGDGEHPLARLRRLVERAPSRRRRVLADDVELTADYILVAALNTPRIGPNVEFAPGADPGDGKLDLLLVREHEREALVRNLHELEHGASNGSPLPTRRVRRVLIEWDKHEGHVDDARWPAKDATDGAGDGPSFVELAIAEAPLRVLVPRAG